MPNKLLEELRRKEEMRRKEMSNANEEMKTKAKQKQQENNARRKLEAEQSRIDRAQAQYNRCISDITKQYNLSDGKYSELYCDLDNFNSSKDNNTTAKPILLMEVTEDSNVQLEGYIHHLHQVEITYPDSYKDKIQYPVFHTPRVVITYDMIYSEFINNIIKKCSKVIMVLKGSNVQKKITFIERIINDTFNPAIVHIFIEHKPLLNIMNGDTFTFQQVYNNPQKDFLNTKNEYNSKQYLYYINYTQILSTVNYPFISELSCDEGICQVAGENVTSTKRLEEIFVSLLNYNVKYYILIRQDVTNIVDVVNMILNNPNISAQIIIESKSITSGIIPFHLSTTYYKEANPERPLSASAPGRIETVYNYDEILKELDDQIKLINGQKPRSMGGGINKIKPSKKKVQIKNRKYTVYVGPRGGEYVRMNNEFVPLRKFIHQTA